MGSWRRLATTVTTVEACERYAGMIEEIKRLKVERRAVVLAHNYQRPEIFEVADFYWRLAGVGAQRSRRARRRGDCFCGVSLHGGDGEGLQSGRKVLLPDLKAGCSLADSVTAEALAERKEELLKIYPDLKVVSYVNCTADVKALSGRVLHVGERCEDVERIDSDNVLFVPDQNLANYVQSQTSKRIISWDGNCYVHHQITPEESKTRSSVRFPGSRCWRIRSAGATCSRWRTR